MRNGNYDYSYEELDIDYLPRRAYIIIDQTLFLFHNGEVDEWWDLEGETINELIYDARLKSGMITQSRIWVDTECYFEAEMVIETGRLTQAYDYKMDSEEREAWAELVEYLMDCE